MPGHFIQESLLTTNLLKKIIPVSTEQDAPCSNSENEYQSEFELEIEESNPDDPREIEESLLTYRRNGKMFN